MVRLPYLPLWVDDFLGSNAVAGMTTEEIGAYLMLLMRAWKGEPAATVPGDDQTLARWAGLTPDRWAKVKASVLGPWIDAGNGRLVQPRLKREWDRVQDASMKKQASGRAGAEKRWQRHSNAMAPPLANAWQPDSTPDSIFQKPDEKAKDKDPPKPPRNGGDAVEWDDLPVGLQSPEFRKAWEDWKADRKARKKPMTERAKVMQLRKLAEMGVADAIRAIEHSLASGYTGIFPAPESRNGFHRPHPSTSRIDIAAARRAAESAREFAEPDLALPIRGGSSKPAT